MQISPLWVGTQNLLNSRQRLDSVLVGKLLRKEAPRLNQFRVPYLAGHAMGVNTDPAYHKACVLTAQKVLSI